MASATDTPTLTQDNRPIGLSATSLGKDKLLLEQFSMSEGLSRPFRMSVTCLAAPDYTLPFENLLGQSVTVRLDVPGGGETRYFNGIVYKITEGAKVHSPDTGKFLMRYWVEVMPSLRRACGARCKAASFSTISVPDILKKVLTGFTVKWELQGTFQPRDYCVQYHESDFQFASRLMEEEGIFYFFKHTRVRPHDGRGQRAQQLRRISGQATVVFNDFKRLARRPAARRPHHPLAEIAGDEVGKVSPLGPHLRDAGQEPRSDQNDHGDRLGRHDHAPSQGRRQRPMGNLRISRRLCRAASTASTKEARRSRLNSARSSKTTPARSTSACSRSPPAP